MLIIMLGSIDDDRPDFTHMFMGDRAWKNLDDYLGQGEGYSAEKYKNQVGTVKSKKDGKTYELWVGIS